MAIEILWWRRLRDVSYVQPKSYSHNPGPIIDNQCSILVLTGAFEDALKLLQAQLDEHLEDNDLRFTMATCLLHMERYNEAAAAYEQAMTKDKDWYDDTGLKAARRSQQPAWANL
jgi:tetratricopeptide (TPR) repeat protein